MSDMARGILAQPYSLAMHSDYSRLQFYNHVQVLLAERDQLKAENETLRSALKAAEDAMWHADGNMDGEAADARDALASAGKGESS